MLIQGDLNLTSGTIATTNATATITIQGNVTGTGSQTATSVGKLIMTGSGKTLSSGVTYDNVEINSAGNISLTGTTTFTGVTTLTSGNLDFGANTVTYITAATQIVKTAGFITLNSGTNLVFGLGGGITVPDNSFNGSSSIASLTIKRAESGVTAVTMNWGNNPVTVTGNLDIISGNTTANTTFSTNNAAGIITVNGNLNFTSGTATSILTTVGNITVNGDVVLISGTATHNGAGKIIMTGKSSIASIAGITYSNLELNSANNFALNASTNLSGILTLTAGDLTVGANSLTLYTSNTPIVRTAGTITVSSSSNLSFGTTGFLTGNAFVIPNNTFSSSPAVVNNFTVNRTNSLSLGNQGLTINGTLTLESGVFNAVANTLTSQNANTPIARTTGTLTISNTGSLIFGTAGNLGGNAFSIPNSTFTTTPLTITNFTVNRTNTLSLGNQALVVIGTLSLTAGVFDVTNASITFQTGNTPIARTAGSLTIASTSDLVFGTVGNTGGTAFTIPNDVFTFSPLVVNNVIINRTNPLTFNNQSLTVNGSLTLTLGTFGFANTLTFQNGNTPMVRTAGTLSLSSTADLIFGTTGNTGGTAFSIPNSFFTSTPSINSFTVNRTNSLTLGNQDITLAANLTLTAGTLNDAARTITVNGNIAGTGTHTGSGTIVMPTGSTTISGATLNNIQLNNAGGFSLTGSPTITGTLTLSNGALAVGSNTLTFHTANTPISRTSGTITLASTSNLVFGITGNTAGSAFTIPNNTFTSNTEFANLSINRTNDLTLNNQNFALTGVLSIAAGRLILPASYLFTLRSTSISNTAMVSPVGATGSIFYNTGAAFLVERYIPQQTGSGVRAYRDVAPSVNSGSGKIFTNWQESGTNGLVNGVYYGTHITGKSGFSPGGIDATTGFDLTQTGSKAFYTNDVSLVTGDAIWNAVNSTNQTNDTLSAFKGYRILIRGNRLVNLYQSPTPTTMNAPATLRSTGKLVTGDVAFTTSGVTANGATNTGIRLNSATSTGYTMIGNPYASAVDWDLVYADAATANVSSTYTIIDPNIGLTGGYAIYQSSTGVSVPFSSAINHYIQPGQAFFIQNTSTSPAITFKESHKATNTANLTATFRTTNLTSTVSRIYVNLKKTVAGRGDLLMDGLAVTYDSNFSNAIGNEDADKVSNGAENICILSNSKQLSIEGRHAVTINDTIQMNLWQVTAGSSYQLEINTANFISNGLEAYLIDAFSNIQTSLSMTGITKFYFTTTSNTASYNNRFKIVFKSSNALPVSFISLNANQNLNTVNVNWNVSESNIRSYEIERSSDAQSFIKQGTLNAKGSVISSIQNYSFNDAAPLTGNNFYRIRAIATDGKIMYSNVVLIRMNSKDQNITIYPNPVKGKIVNLLLQNIAQDNFDVKVFSLNGQMVYGSTIKHNGGSGTQAIVLPNLPAGTYHLSIHGLNYSTQLNFIAE
jgi:hypothetical protein